MDTRGKKVGKALLAALLVIFISTWPAHAKHDAPDEGPLAGLGMEPPRQVLPAPEFDLADLEDQAVGLKSFQGRLLLLHFWAAWGPSAPADLTALEKLQKALAGEPVSVVAVATDTLGRPSVESFLAEHPVSLPVLLDPEGSTLRPYGVRVLPTTLLIDGKGRIVGRVVGSRQWGGEAALGGLKKVVKAPRHYGIITSGLPVNPAERSR